MSSVTARLELLCEVNRRLASFVSLEDLLGYATSRTREPFDAEGCALLLVVAAAGVAIAVGVRRVAPGG